MNRDHVLQEIRRIAQANGGSAPGVRKFESETGIKEGQVVGVFWRAWSDALREAGLKPNTMQAGYERAYLIEKYVALARELGRLPTVNDIRFKHCGDPQFPSEKTWRRIGDKGKLVDIALTYCKEKQYDDVIMLCERYVPRSQSQDLSPNSGEDVAGFVYLIKSGRYYKIGRTNATGRREYEIALQLPEKSSKIHEIRTDDPNGIEAYWHRRFEARRKNGEWFELTAQDVAAFKRRKFM